MCGITVTIYKWSIKRTIYKWAFWFCCEVSWLLAVFYVLLNEYTLS